jgi:hypothetical protein
MRRVGPANAGAPFRFLRPGSTQDPGVLLSAAGPGDGNGAPAGQNYDKPGRERALAKAGRVPRSGPGCHKTERGVLVAHEARITGLVCHHGSGKW